MVKILNKTQPRQDGVKKIHDNQIQKKRDDFQTDRDRACKIQHGSCGGKGQKLCVNFVVDVEEQKPSPHNRNNLEVSKIEKEDEDASCHERLVTGVTQHQVNTN